MLHKCLFVCCLFLSPHTVIVVSEAAVGVVLSSLLILSSENELVAVHDVVFFIRGAKTLSLK